MVETPPVRVGTLTEAVVDGIELVLDGVVVEGVNEEGVCVELTVVDVEVVLTPSTVRTSGLTVTI